MNLVGKCNAEYEHQSHQPHYPFHPADAALRNPETWNMELLLHMCEYSHLDVQIAGKARLRSIVVIFVTEPPKLDH